MTPTTDWEQPADRHSQLIDPVITVRQLSRFEFARKTLTRIDHALVFSKPNGSFDTYLPPRRPTRAEVASQRYTSVYEVDMGVHHIQAEIKLPSDNDALEFGVLADLSWQVREPGEFVAGGHRDVPRLLLGELEQAARPLARRHAIAASAAAEAKILEALTARGPLGSRAGLQVKWTVRLRRDQENISHQLRLQAINHTAVEQLLAQERGMGLDVMVDRRNRQQDELMVSRAMAYGMDHQRLALQKQQHDHERKVVELRQQVELQKLEGEKIAFYQYHLEQGGVHGLAFHLAQHPEDSRLVMENMRADQLAVIRAQMDLGSELLGGDDAEDHELEGPKQLALRAIMDILGRLLPGAPEQGETPPQLPAYPGSQRGQQGYDPGLPESAPPSSPEIPASAPLSPAAAPASPPPATAPAQDPVPTTPPPADGSIARWQPPPGYGIAPVMPGQAPTHPPGLPQQPAAPASADAGDMGDTGLSSDGSP